MAIDYNNCDHLDAHYDFYYVAEAALLWCGVPAADIKEELLLASYNSEIGVFVHPNIRCLEKYSRIIHSAINFNTLPAGREGRGCNFDNVDHITPAKRTVTRDSLKKWIANEFPGNKPDFLFDEIEKAAHPSITIESFTALQARNDLLQTRLDKATIEFKVIREQLKTAEQELSEKNHITESDRTKLLKQIAVMALLLAEKSNKFKRSNVPNALQIANEVQEILDAGTFNNRKGTGSTEIRNSISEGLKLLQTGD